MDWLDLIDVSPLTNALYRPVFGVTMGGIALKEHQRVVEILQMG